MKRTLQSRYSGDSYGAAQVIKVKCPTLGRLLTFLEGKLHRHEQLDVHSWYGSLFYVVIRDMRGEGIVHLYPRDMRAGLTVDLASDTVQFADSTEVNESGGNCFVRAPKWKTILRRHFNLGIDRLWRAQFRVYGDTEFFPAVKRARIAAHQAALSAA